MVQKGTTIPKEAGLRNDQRHQKNQRCVKLSTEATRNIQHVREGKLCLINHDPPKKAKPCFFKLINRRKFQHLSLNVVFFSSLGVDMNVIFRGYKLHNPVVRGDLKSLLAHVSRTCLFVPATMKRSLHAQSVRDLLRSFIIIYSLSIGQMPRVTNFSKLSRNRDVHEY